LLSVSILIIHEPKFEIGIDSIRESWTLNGQSRIQITDWVAIWHAFF